MGLRCVVGTVPEPPKPFWLRLRSRHQSSPGRIDGRLRLGRGGAGVPHLSEPHPVSFIVVGTPGRWRRASWPAPGRPRRPDRPIFRPAVGRTTAWARRIGGPEPWPVVAPRDSNRKSDRPAARRWIPVHWPAKNLLIVNLYIYYYM